MRWASSESMKGDHHGWSTQLTMTVVLVHGGFVDGSGWEGVYRILRKDGYTSVSSRIRPSRWPMMSRQPGASLPRRTAPSFSSATPMAAS